MLCYSQGNSNVVTTVSVIILYQLKFFKDVLHYKFTVQTMLFKGPLAIGSGPTEITPTVLIVQASYALTPI